MLVGREGFRSTFVKLSISSNDENDSNANEKEKECDHSVMTNEKTNNVAYLSMPEGTLTSTLSLLLCSKSHERNTTEAEDHSNNNNCDYELARMPRLT